MVRQEIEKDPKRTEIKDPWYNDEIADALRKSAWRTRSPFLYNVRIADHTIVMVRYKNCGSRSSTVALTSSINSAITGRGSTSCVRLSHKAIRSMTRANRRQPRGSRPP